MAASKNSSKLKSSRGESVKPAPATLRSTSGAGFDLEDHVSAWQLVKALSGERAPGIDAVATQIQAQVSTLGWHIDDLLLTRQAAAASRRLAISVKGNLQVTAAGVPADFVKRAWDQWRDLQGPFNRATDELALVTVGTHHEFDPTWREVKNACSGPDSVLAMSRIRSNRKQSGVFDSVKKPGSASDEETIELIRRLHVIPTDFQLAHSENENQAIAQCRRLLVSGSDSEAQSLWEGLIDVAKGGRLRSGTITVSGLLALFRSQFGLRHHPDFEHDWEALSNITADYKARIETELPSGYAVPRTAEKAALQAALANNLVTVVFGESGSGKSALVKTVLDGEYASWNQVWFGPDELRTALSAARRSTIPLKHELSLVLQATVKPQNILVIDSAERIEANEFVVIRRLLQAILPNDVEESSWAWKVVIVTQTQSWGEYEETILSGRKAHLVEVETLKSDAVKLVLRSWPTLGWLTGHDDTVAALTNLKTLAWVLQAGAALGKNASGLASHTAIADRLWKHWTKERPDMQVLMMNLAKREASFKRSFALTDLAPAEAATFTQRPQELPLRLNERTSRIEFEHDLAADWARFQYLKQIWIDTPQWAALVGNPLWTNALRMLGQFLLREPAETGTAWDLAFEATEAANNQLAGNILLDALCLDPDAERFLTERVDLLLGDGAKNFTRLLMRFHHVATVPSGGAIDHSALGLYMEAQYRSIVFGRWPSVLRFLIAQRKRLAELVSSALAKVIHTWLTKTPQTLSSGARMPYRLEMAQMALDMARNVQVEKGHGVIYAPFEPLLYTAPLAGATDLPTEVGNWALELAGRREIDPDVKRRIAEVQLQKATVHAERLKTDAKYKVLHEERKQIRHSVGSFRARLPPWPLGARYKIDMDFRTACIKEYGIQSLMLAQPELAAEVMLALIIEDQPERESGANRFEIDLGLKYLQDGYPTAFWKSRFFPFLQLAPNAALTSLVALMNFCTERWAAEVMKGRTGDAPGMTLRFADGSERSFPGWGQVFCWPQSNATGRKGTLFCALDALERWLTLRLDVGEDITGDIEMILREGKSAALVSVLVNVAKYRPSLLVGPLSALITFPNLFYWDSKRVEQVGYNFIGWDSSQGGQAMFDLARDWILGPHRKKKFLDVVVELLQVDVVIARRLQTLLPTWALPEDPKEALEFKLFFARLDQANYHIVTDPTAGAQVKRFVCPNELRIEVQSWRADKEPALAYFLVPSRCEQLIRGGQLLADDEAADLFNLFQECDAGAAGEDEHLISNCRVATASTLIILGGAWLIQNPEAQQRMFEVVRASLAAVAATGEEIRGRRVGIRYDELKFVAYAAMHLWLAAGDGVLEWETAVLRVLTSGDKGATAVVIGVAYINREQLGTAWWRLLRAGLFWTGLVLLVPHHGDGEGPERVWTAWLARLRRFPLRGPQATPDDIDFKRVAAGRERLNFWRRMRLYDAGEQIWDEKPECERGGLLDGHLLEVLFNWLVEGRGTDDHDLDTRLVLRIWDYDVTRAKACEKTDGEYDLPSQDIGYDILLKLGALCIATPAGDGRAIWEPVLVHGPAAHYALQHFIRGLFLRLVKGDNPVVFERVWRATVEYGLVADWSQPGLWFYGERLICDLLGFGNENALARLKPGGALRMSDLYKRWAATHLVRDEECITRFCHFLTTEFGSPLRLDGLLWLAVMLKECDPPNRWYREGTGQALVELVATAVSADAHALSQKVHARQALVDIAAALAALNIPTALALQERIKQLR